MKWFLVIAATGLLACGAGCSDSSQAFEVTSPDGRVISGASSAGSTGISAPSLIQTPTISNISGSGRAELGSGRAELGSGAVQ